MRSNNKIVLNMIDDNAHVALFYQWLAACEAWEQVVWERGLQGDESNMQEVLDAANYLYAVDGTVEQPMEEVKWQDNGKDVSEILPGELAGLHLVETEDYEVERFVGYDCDDMGVPVPIFDDGRDISAYFTTSGDNPVILSEAEQAEAKRSEGGWTDISPDTSPAFYSISKAIPRKEWASQESNFHKVVGYVWKNKANKDKLAAAWKKFWTRVYSQKKTARTFKGKDGKLVTIQVGNFLTSKQVKTCRELFERFGIKAAPNKDTQQAA